MKIYAVKAEKVVEVKKPAAGKNNTVWVRSITPNEEEIKQLSEFCRAPIEEFREFMGEEERPRLDLNKNSLQVIYSSPYKDNGEILTVPVTIFVHNNIVITVEKNRIKALDDLEKLFSQKKVKYLLKKNSAYFLENILDRINDEFLFVIDRISDYLELFQETQPSSKDKFDKVYSLSVTLAFFNQSILANLEVLNSLRKVYFKQFTKDDKEAFEELYYNALHILDTEKIQRDLMSNLFNLQSVMSTNRLNSFMKRLTSIALIIMVPTLISGIYGMNFTHLPLSDHPYGFYIVTGAMFGLSIALLGFFKLVDWL